MLEITTILQDKYFLSNFILIIIISMVKVIKDSIYQQFFFTFFKEIYVVVSLR